MAKLLKQDRKTITPAELIAVLLLFLLLALISGGPSPAY
jgi:hypothetical protein